MNTLQRSESSQLSQLYDPEADMRDLPVPARIKAVENLRLRYPRWDSALGRIERCHMRNKDSVECQGVLLTGLSGVGKSTLCSSYAERYPVLITPTGVQRRVVSASVPSWSVRRSLPMAILRAMGDPRYDKGTVDTMTYRILQLFEDCGVELLLLDEIQHFVDQDSEKLLLNATNWLKALIKDSKVATVLVGLKGDAERVVSSNKQLDRLFGDAVILSPFEWDESRPETIKEFRTCLAMIERLLPLREPSNLGSSRAMSEGCFKATNGLMGFMMPLLREATRQALISGREHIDMALLSSAFTEVIAAERRHIPNPFLD